MLACSRRGLLGSTLAIGLLAGCRAYAENATDTVEVSSIAALESAIDVAPPGRNILIAPGTYAGGTHTFSPSGADNNPVVVRPRDGIGTVTINAARWTLTGSRFVLSGIYFNDAGIDLDHGASVNRITRCRFRQIGRNAIQLYAATDTRIDHCDAADYLSDTNGKGFVRFRHTNVGNGTLKRVLIDYCHVHDINPDIASNGMEPIGQSSSAGGALFANAEVTLDHVLMRNIGPIPDEGELLGLKSGGWTIQHCTFENNHSSMYINLPRQGFDMTVRSCWFAGPRSDMLRVGSDNPLIIGNRFVGNQLLAIMAGTHNWAEIIALGSPPQNAYSAARWARVIGNILDTGTIQVGRQVGRLTMNHPASNAVLEANIRDGAAATTSNGVIYVNQTGTTISATTAASFTPAVRLTPADVGPFAP